MKRQAYGFRDIEFFKLEIMALHEAKYALADEPKKTLAVGTSDESVSAYNYTQYGEQQSIPSGASTTSYPFDQTGKIIEIRDQLGNITAMTYNLAGKPLRTTRPLLGTNTYTEYVYKRNVGKQIVSPQSIRRVSLKLCNNQS